MTRLRLTLLILPLLFLDCGSPERLSVVMRPMGSAWDPFLDSLQARTISFFLETTDSLTGMALDRYPSPSPASIAAVGFALTTYPIGAERGILTREQAARRTFNTLRHFYALPQGVGGSRRSRISRLLLSLPQNFRQFPGVELRALDHRYRASHGRRACLHNRTLTSIANRNSKFALWPIRSIDGSTGPGRAKGRKGVVLAMGSRQGVRRKTHGTATTSP